MRSGELLMGRGSYVLENVFLSCHGKGTIPVENRARMTVGFHSIEDAWAAARTSWKR
jgi:hypothetical protein